MGSPAAPLGAVTSLLNAETPQMVKAEMLELMDRLSKVLLDSYVETDEDIGPRIQKFTVCQEQLNLIGEQLARLRDAGSAAHEAHKLLAKLASEDCSVPAMRTFGERQEAQASLSHDLAASYERFVSIVVNQLEGLATVVSNKYAAYCNKVIEVRRRKAQLQLMVKQRERSDLRSLERSLIPPAGGAQAAFTVDLEGPLFRQSPTTKLWWACHARLDAKRKVLLFTNRQSDPASAAIKAVALCKYALAHELPEHHVKRPAAFELVPLLPDLPFVLLATDGSMSSRRWVCALQEAIDRPSEDVSAPPAAPNPDDASGTPPLPAAHRAEDGSMLHDTMKPIVASLEQLVDYGSTKIDELDKKLSGTLAEQSHRTEIQLAQLNSDTTLLAEFVVTALDEFQSSMRSNMSVELLRLTEAQLEYHRGMAAHLEQITSSLRKASPVDSGESTIPASPTPAPAPTPTAPPPASSSAPPPFKGEEEDEIID